MGDTLELTYKILASDGQEYGPYGLDVTQGWINQGRITPTTQTIRSDQTDWQDASQFEEFLKALMARLIVSRVLGLGSLMRGLPSQRQIADSACD